MSVRTTTWAGPAHPARSILTIVARFTIASYLSPTVRYEPPGRPLAYQGIGELEPLRHEIANGEVRTVACRYHYLR